MSANTEAYSHLDSFDYYNNHPDYTRSEKQLHNLGALQTELDDLISIRVKQGIQAKEITWAEVGKIFGLTHQGAMKRWKKW